jgi:hypothetical protein
MTAYRTDLVNETSNELTTFLHIRWGFLFLPFRVVIAGSVLMLASLAESTRWGIPSSREMSELATLMHGLDDQTRLQMRMACTHISLTEAGVQLVEGLDGLELQA